MSCRTPSRRAPRRRARDCCDPGHEHRDLSLLIRCCPVIPQQDRVASGEPSSRGTDDSQSGGCAFARRNGGELSPLHGDGQPQPRPTGIRTGGSRHRSRTRPARRSRREGQVAPEGGAPLEPRLMGAQAGSARSHRSAGGAGRRATARARADSLRADVDLAVRLLSGCGVCHGLGPGRFAAHRHSGAALRRCASGQLRRLRLAGAAVAVRPQRLRRDPSRAVGMGREAAGSERRRRGPRERL